MMAPARLGLYGLVLVAVFAVAGFTANTVIPEGAVQAWVEETPEDHHGTEEHDDERVEMKGGHEGHEVDAAPLGLGLAQDGYQLTEVNTPTETGTEGELSLAVTGPDAQPVTDFELDHEQEMHLIAVRADGQHFRHVHPERDETGTWSVPWEWDEAGTYRVFADFVSTDTGEGVTLSTTVQVAGDYDPNPATETVTEADVHGFDVAVEGDFVAGEASQLTMTVSRQGEPVTELEPYLGAFGHLVALRDGDLAYLHVHPHGDAPSAGETSGPEIVFEATAPTPGRYLLFLDFQIDGQVYTAPLVIDTTTESRGGDTGSGSGHEEEGEDRDH
ncbi:heavy-metal-associated domain-containing protein [Nesterenkonia sp. HG001]|uniref:heavy-metal-associated domain-containing protein n=1 Tax=Nesterenkonia sp. HG001 TaxID=2983207 RepID=UPI002AC599BA|nr:heavy-metal-associated domain-containing protein [Nesterenkonia sp. HG001]MDZ5077836.1 heavy-metal-associated domain-containing protein [Nesterenkonia sp. HG001]